MKRLLFVLTFLTSISTLANAKHGLIGKHSGKTVATNSNCTLEVSNFPTASGEKALMLRFEDNKEEMVFVQLLSEMHYSNVISITEVDSIEPVSRVDLFITLNEDGKPKAARLGSIYQENLFSLKLISSSSQCQF